MRSATRRLTRRLRGVCVWSLWVWFQNGEWGLGTRWEWEVGESVCRISQPSLRALSDVQRATAYLQIAPLIITACSSGAGTRLTRAHHVSALAGGWAGVWLHLLFETSGRRVTVGKWASGQVGSGQSRVWAKMTLDRLKRGRGFARKGGMAVSSEAVRGCDTTPGLYASISD